ncbi:hypothetical protein [Rhodanobacter spathiphylli]|uniref:hypothetical protein n=1 Tax=Rhodanobacter spathiphylli TaxID=347483 RepID=UPI0012F8E204|nr:hypothetical protein [Rhodanobacter spathiphylli]
MAPVACFVLVRKNMCNSHVLTIFIGTTPELHPSAKNNGEMSRKYLRIYAVICGVVFYLLMHDERIDGHQA